VLLGVFVLLAAMIGSVPAPSVQVTSRGSVVSREGNGPQPVAGPLFGRLVVIDPGHHLGNARHPRKIRRKVDAGGLRKPCNTEGTQTAAGYAEAEFTLSAARYLRQRLVEKGAVVHLTRTDNDRSGWGPCIDMRGRAGNLTGADLLISIHADGAGPGRRGFHVIQPALRKGYTDDIHAESGVLARDLRAALRAAGMRYSTGHRDGLDTRGDLGTLNWSDVPAVMVEAGNMRNPRDAAQLSSARWRSRVLAAGLAAGVEHYLTRGTP
jgi:N-acetylmuramoyl-L-alanine amidase